MEERLIGRVSVVGGPTGLVIAGRMKKDLETGVGTKSPSFNPIRRPATGSKVTSDSVEHASRT